MSSENRPIDALSYIDEYDDASRDFAQQLVEQEMNAMAAEGMTINDYVRDTDDIRFGSEILRHEYERVVAERPMDKIDTSRYALEAPSGPLRSDVQAWRKAVTQAKSMAMHQADR